MKNHKIKTVNDILKVITLENYDRFTTDFLVIFHTLVQAKEKLTEEELKDFKIKEINWIDDNIHRTGYKFNDGKVIWDKDER